MKTAKETLTRKFSINNVLKAGWILYGSLSILLTIFGADRLISWDYSSITSITLKDSWRIAINDDVYQDISLEEFRFQPVDVGDEIIMQREIPKDLGITEGVLRLHIRQTAVKLYMDDEIVYEYGLERKAEGKTIGSGFQFINFPEAYQGKTLTIHLYVAEDKAFARFDPIEIYEWQDAYRVLMTENRVPLFLGCFLLIFGVVVCIITVVALVFSRKYLKVFCISLFSICMGLWTLCYYNVILIFSIPLYSVSMIEYLSLYFTPIPLTVYMYESVKSLESKFLKVLYWALLSVQVLCITGMLVLHTIDVVHMAATLKYMQVLIILSLLYFLIIVVLNLRSRRSTNKVFLIGMLAIAVCIIYDLLGYCCNRYLGENSFFALKGVSSIGVLVFIMILIVSFYVSLTQKMMQETERNSLIKSAYTDELTQLHNRRYCMEYMNRIKEDHITDFAVVCFDLNNLKSVNDTYGHAKGDILIKSAAEVIAETFEEYGIVARMGGDEFIAVLKTVDGKEAAALMEQFQKNIDRKNQEVSNLNMSIACGYALGSSEEGDIEKVYQTADNWMYENKKQMKLAL